MPKTHKSYAGSSAATAVEEPPEQPLPEPEPPDQGPPALLPAGIEALLANPPLLGRTPTSVGQIILAAGPQATYFNSPIVSGRVGSGSVPGLALLSLPLFIDYTMGNFSIPIQFPPQSILLWAATVIYNSFNGSVDTTFQLGTGNGRNDILAATSMGAIHTTAIHPVTGTLPFVIDPNPFQAWVTVNNQGATAGQGGLLLLFMRLSAQWN